MAVNIPQHLIQLPGRTLLFSAEQLDAVILKMQRFYTLKHI